MIGRVILAALLAGVAAGLILSAIQYLRLTPLIIAAEQFEVAGETHSHVGSAQTTALSHEDENTEWVPQEESERTLFTTGASIVSGAGFAGLLAGVSLLAGIPINRRNGAIWGLCGFLAVTLAPAAGLPPELPGMPAGDLVERQLWWLGTIAATSLAIYLIAVRREPWAAILAVALIALPHLIGAPQTLSHETRVPAGLSAEFAANAIAANAVFWVLIGLFLGYAFQLVLKDSTA